MKRIKTWILLIIPPRTQSGSSRYCSFHNHSTRECLNEGSCHRKIDRPDRLGLILRLMIALGGILGLILKILEFSL